MLSRPKIETPDPQIRSGAPDPNRIIPLDFRQSEQQVTGWQSHSVRGFLAGIVRKRLKLDLESAVVEVSGSIGSRLSKARRPRKRGRTAARPDRYAASQDRCGGPRDLLRRSRDRAPARS